MRSIVRPKRHGIALIYVMVIFTAMIGVVSLAVDGGQYYLAKTQLQMAADAAARFGVAAMPQYDSTGKVTNSPNLDRARSSAAASVADNPLFGSAVSFDPSDPASVSFYSYDPTNQQLTTLGSPPFAMQVTLHKSIPLIFARILGIPSINVTATSTAAVRPTEQAVNDAPGTNCIWLSGMPDGATADRNCPPSHNYDVAGTHTYAKTSLDPVHTVNARPDPTQNLTLVPGESLAFDSISGNANNNQAGQQYGPDGNAAWIANKVDGAENGMSNLRCPMNAVIGVFLDDSKPSLSTPPSTLDFSSASSRDFVSLAPELRQVFYIGDGQTSTGLTQHFVIPPGATRLFIGNMDEYEWNNNTGSRTTIVIRPAVVFLVNNSPIVAGQTPPADGGDQGSSGGSGDSGESNNGGDSGSGSGNNVGGNDGAGNSGGGNNSGSNNGGGNNGGGWHDNGHGNGGGRGGNDDGRGNDHGRGR